MKPTKLSLNYANKSVEKGFLNSFTKSPPFHKFEKKNYTAIFLLKTYF